MVGVVRMPLSLRVTYNSFWKQNRVICKSNSVLLILHVIKNNRCITDDLKSLYLFNCSRFAEIFQIEILQIQLIQTGKENYL